MRQPAFEHKPDDDMGVRTDSEDITSKMYTSEREQEWRKRPTKLQKQTQVVRPRDKDERGAHSEKTAR